jgi:hypothetical protein
MAESNPPGSEPSQAQAEFARWKDRAQQSDAGSSAPFATPLPTSAIPAWSLQPPPPPPHGGPGHWGPGHGPGPAQGVRSGSIVNSLGATIRLGVDVLNAALASSLQMLDTAGYSVGWGEEHCDCGECDSCCGYDCCSVMGCGCGCCEPSVGSCC